MTTAALPFPPRTPRLASAGTPPRWMLIGGALMVLSCVPAFWPWQSDRTLDNVVGVSFLLRIVLNAAAYAWAARRVELPARFRQVLQLHAITGAIGAVVSSLQLVGTMWHAVLPRWLSPILLLLIVGLRATAVFRHPRVQARGGTLALAADVLISLVGFGTIAIVLVTLPSLERAEPRFWWGLVTSEAVQLVMLAALNVLILRGQMLPSRRAFWCMVAGLATFVPVQVLNQLEVANVIGYGWSASLYYLGVLADLAAAWFIRTDALPTAAHARQPRSLGGLNPVPLAAPVALGIFLVVAVLQAAPQRVAIFGCALVLATALLVVRMVQSGRETARLEAAEHDRALQLEREKTEAIGRLAGGIAHEFNNAMTVVMGCAELGQKEADDPAAVREDFTMIHEAAGRVVSLTTRLLAFSGRQAMVRRPIDLQAAVLQKLPAIRAALPAGITLVADHVEPVGELPVDAHQFSFMCRQLLDNAIEAMPDGGSLVLSLRLQHMPQPVATLTHVLPAGWYATYVVRDSGIGIPAELQRKVFDPFFSTRKMHEASGLGLAAVQGIIAAHDGGIVIDSAPGRGTAVTIHLPATAPA